VWLKRVGGKRGLLSAKGGLMMGTKKVGVFSSPQKKTISYYIEKINFVKKKNKYFEIFLKMEKNG